MTTRSPLKRRPNTKAAIPQVVPRWIPSTKGPSVGERTSSNTSRCATGPRSISQRDLAHQPVARPVASPIAMASSASAVDIGPRGISRPSSAPLSPAPMVAVTRRWRRLCVALGPWRCALGQLRDGLTHRGLRSPPAWLEIDKSRSWWRPPLWWASAYGVAVQHRILSEAPFPCIQRAKVLEPMAKATRGEPRLPPAIHSQGQT